MLRGKERITSRRNAAKVRQKLTDTKGREMQELLAFDAAAAAASSPYQLQSAKACLLTSEMERLSTKFDILSLGEKPSCPVTLKRGKASKPCSFDAVERQRRFVAELSLKKAKEKQLEAERQERLAQMHKVRTEKMAERAKKRLGNDETLHGETVLAKLRRKKKDSHVRAETREEERDYEAVKAVRQRAKMQYRDHLKKLQEEKADKARLEKEAQQKKEIFRRKIKKQTLRSLYEMKRKAPPAEVTDVVEVEATPEEDGDDVREERRRGRRAALLAKKRADREIAAMIDEKKKREQEEQEQKLRLRRRAEIIRERVLQRGEELRKQKEEHSDAAPTQPLESEAQSTKRITTDEANAIYHRLTAKKSEDELTSKGGRDFRDWKRRNGVEETQRVFCLTGWYPCVKKDLEDRGWFFNPERESRFFDLKWTLYSQELKAVTLEDFQLTNHFMKNTVITTKIGLMRSLRTLPWFADAHADAFFPRSYDLSNPLELRDFVDDFRCVHAENLLKEVVRKALGGDAQLKEILDLEDDELDEVLDNRGEHQEHQDGPQRIPTLPIVRWWLQVAAGQPEVVDLITARAAAGKDAVAKSILERASQQQQQQQQQDCVEQAEKAFIVETGDDVDDVDEVGEVAEEERYAVIDDSVEEAGAPAKIGQHQKEVGEGPVVEVKGEVGEPEEPEELTSKRGDIIEGDNVDAEEMSQADEGGDNEAMATTDDDDDDVDEEEPEVEVEDEDSASFASSLPSDAVSESVDDAFSHLVRDESLSRERPGDDIKGDGDDDGDDHDDDGDDSNVDDGNDNDDDDDEESNDDNSSCRVEERPRSRVLYTATDLGLGEGGQLVVNPGVLGAALAVTARSICTAQEALDSGAASDGSSPRRNANIESHTSNFGGSRCVDELDWEALTSAPSPFVAVRLPAEQPVSLESVLWPEEKPSEKPPRDLRERRLWRRRQERHRERRSGLIRDMQVLEPIGKDALRAVIKALRERRSRCAQFGIQSSSSEQKSANTWIVKPGAKSRGRGIRTFNDLEALLDYVDAKTLRKSNQIVANANHWVVQKYIENPLLVGGHKFDIRQWVLVTSWNPLTIWVCSRFYCRFAVESYETSDAALHDKYIHLVNNSISKNSANFHRDFTAENGETVHDHMWSMEHFLRWTEHRSGSDVFETNTRPKMMEAIRNSLLTVQDMVEDRKNSWELYGYDFMVDEEFNPWLIEINSSPACDYSTDVAESYVKEALTDILKVVLDWQPHQEQADKRRRPSSSEEEEPDTGVWKLLHRGSFMVTPMTSLGSDLVLRGKALNIKKTRQNPAVVNIGI
eukprot:scaffold385_cov305-Pinguiococcus_pyrenoidosus.AAC.23